MTGTIKIDSTSAVSSVAVRLVRIPNYLRQRQPGRVYHRLSLKTMCQRKANMACLSQSLALKDLVEPLPWEFHQLYYLQLHCVFYDCNKSSEIIIFLCNT